MTAHPESPIAAVKQHHRLADIAGRTGLYLPATAGTLTVRCPMPAHGHPDRTPSMRLYLDDDRYYCFGCGSKGDVIQWVQDAEGLDVAGALRTIDERRRIANAWAGQTPTHGHHRAPGPTEGPDPGRTAPARVRAVLAAAWDLATSSPLHHAGAVYVNRRGIHVDVLEAFTGRAEVGHTPARPDGMVRALQADGFDDDELVDAGLAIRRADRDAISDFYRHRVLLPIRNPDGQVCGLVGRNVGDPRFPKYKNPPLTVTYDKSINLYQPLPTPTHPAGRVVVVEGTLDALAIATTAIRAGIADRVCPLTQSGRELSSAQLDWVLHVHPNPPTIAFDADPAGRESTVRMAAAAQQRGAAVQIARLPEGQDPASWLATQGSRSLRVLIAPRAVEPTSPLDVPASVATGVAL
jgi:DNA primase